MASDRPPSRTVPAAVSTLSAALVRGPAVPAEVIGVHPFALYLDVAGRVLPVLTSDAVPLPTALRLAEPSGTVSWGVVAGEAVLVGAGRVSLPGVDVVATRTWRPARVRGAAVTVGCSGGRPSSHLSTRLEPSGTGDENGWLADGIRAVVARVGCSGGRRSSQLSTQLSDAELGTAVAGLVGRGPGLTPSGDDALAGALLVACALGTGTDLADAVRARLGATTAVSAALLDAAADGYAARTVVALVDAAVTGDAAAVARALPAVLSLGHTSGVDTVLGIRAALEALTPGVGCSAGRQGSHVGTRLGVGTGWSAA